MRHVDEYRDPAAVESVVRRIRETVTRPWTLMEVCGGQTHSILKFGMDELLPEAVRLVHGPGCPVCVTPLEMIDRAIAIASRPDAIFCSFGDMLRVPGSSDDLLKMYDEAIKWSLGMTQYDVKPHPLPAGVRGPSGSRPLPAPAP